MAREFTDISDLLGKVNNAEAEQEVIDKGVPHEEMMTAQEFVNEVVKPIQELQREDRNNVKAVSINGSEPSYPDEEGVVSLVLAQGNYEQELSLQYDGEELPYGSSLLSADGRIAIGVRYIESRIQQSGNDVIYTPTGNAVRLRIQTRRGTAEYQTVYEDANFMSSAHGTTTYARIDLTPYLVSGAQDVRVTIDNTVNSETFNFIFSATVASLRVQAAGSWYYTPWMPQEGQSDKLDLRYRIYGGVDKTLHIKVYSTDARGESVSREITRYLTASEVYITNELLLSYTDADAAFDFFGKHGVHKIEAWLTCTVDDVTVESAHVTNQVIIVADSTDDSVLIAIQDAVSEVVNYEAADLLRWSIYNPSNEPVDVTFYVTDSSGMSGDRYLTITEPNAENGEIYTLRNTIEVDTQSTRPRVLLHAYVGDTPLLTEDELITIDVDNTTNFSPVSNGLHFYLNPRNRSNSETDPARILDSAHDDDEIEGCTFENMAWMDGVDGWTSDESGQRCLRVAAGSRIHIPYEYLQHLIANNTADRSFAVELDFAVANVSNESDPILQMCTHKANGLPLGLKINPLDGWYMTASANSEQESAFAWQEGARTHIVLSYRHDQSYFDDEGVEHIMPIAKLYINAVPNRSYLPHNEDGLSEFVQRIDGTYTSGGITIGQEGADIFIYGLKVFQTSLSDADVRQNRLASIPKASDKLRFLQRNDILADGLINYEKCLEKGYNVLLWHGQHMNHANGENGDAKFTGYDGQGRLEVTRHGSDGTKDRAHSGTLYGSSMSGQGTTAMTYYEWNMSWKENKNAAIRKFVDLDGNEHSFGYQLDDSDIVWAKKLVGKINYASSMQSHKQGATSLYNDLYRAIVTDSYTDFEAGQRVAVREEAFMYFVQETADSEPVFKGLMTFGAGKADKPTWGVTDESLAAGYSMLEGADNNNPLTDMRTPWTDTDVSYSADDECFLYNGAKNLDFDFGEVDDDEIPTTTLVKRWQPIFNFIYLTNVGIEPYDGTYEELVEAMRDGDLSDRKAYWVTQDSAAGGAGHRFDLFRAKYTGGTSNVVTMVPAGLRLVQAQSYTNYQCLGKDYSEDDVWTDKTADGASYVTLNLGTEFPGVSTAGSWQQVNERFKAARAGVFKQYVDQNKYVHKKSALFAHEFGKLEACTDNRSKNTYYTYNPIKGSMEQHGDDFDTTKKTNNQGFQTKPYFILEHDFDNVNNRYYWEGQDNALQNILELAYGPDGTLASMMQTILRTMNTLVTEQEVSSSGGRLTRTALGCYQKYFFDIQEYFPAVAYSETARIRYELAKVNFIGANTDPISQSLGDQLESEKEYVKRRLIFLSGYALYGAFGDGGTTEGGKISRRGVALLDGSSPTYAFDVNPHYYIYPTGKLGSTMIWPREMAVPGEDPYHLVLGQLQGDTNVELYGTNYVKSLGNMAGFSAAGESFSMQGDRLTSFVVDAEPSVMQFRPTGLSLVAPLLERLVLHNVATLVGTMNMSSYKRLKEVDLRGTGYSRVVFPNSPSLQEVELPSSIEELTLDGLPGLTTLVMEGYDHLTDITIGDNIGELDSRTLLEAIYMAKTSGAAGVEPLQSLSIEGVDWGNVPVALIDWIASMPGAHITGTLTTSETVTYARKVNYIAKWGNIDDESNPLHIVYTSRPISSISVSGATMITEPGDYQFALAVEPANGNDYLSVAWSLTGVSSSYASINAQTGLLHVASIGTEDDAPTAAVTCTLTKSNGSTLAATKNVLLYHRKIQLGDFIYADSSYSPWNEPIEVGKTLIGRCYHADYSKTPADIRMVACRNAYGSSAYWGNYNTAISLYASREAYERGDAALNRNTTPPCVPGGNYTDLGMLTNYGTLGFTSPVTLANYMSGENFVEFATGTAAGNGEYKSLAEFGAEGSGQSAVENYINQQESEVDPRDEYGQSLGDWVEANVDGVSSGATVMRSLADTWKIIRMRNFVLRHCFSSTAPGALPVPRDNMPALIGSGNISTELGAIDHIKNFLSNNGITTTYPYTYDAASYCFAYEPTMQYDDVLPVKYRKHHWGLPCSGDLIRILFLTRIALPGEDTPRLGPVDAVGRNAYIAYPASYAWSCSEYNGPNAWRCDFSSGAVYTNYKNYTYTVRAVAAL